MKKSIAALFLLLGAQAAVAGSQLTYTDLAESGWDCTPPGGHPVHCLPPGRINWADLGSGKVAPKVFTMLVFDATGMVFKGSEHAIRADRYRGQLCPTDPIGPAPGKGIGGYTYANIGVGYYACHHYDSYN